MPTTRRITLLVAGSAALALGAGALIGGAAALSATGADADCAPVTPGAYANDPRAGTTDDGPAGTRSSPYVAGVTLLCSTTHGDAWAISLGSVAVAEGDRSASINGGVTYLGTERGTPADDIRVVVQDSDSENHVAELDSPTGLAPMEAVAVTARIVDLGSADPQTIEVQFSGGDTFFYAA